MNCPFITVFKFYNFLVDRGDKCDVYERIMELAKKGLKNKK